MVIELVKLGKHLTGKVAGRRDFARICSLLAKAPRGGVVFLDLTNVEIINGSWINTAIAPTFRWAAEPQVDIFPLLAHFPGNWLDELELVAQVNDQCFPLVESTRLPVRSVKVIGSIDDYLKLTLQSIAEVEAATGAQLARLQPKIQATAWNNRLKELHDKRLLVRRKEGRQQIYSPLAEEVTFDG